jgi:beta-lactamase regulating signal transducer with metallopeptidase domain
MLLTWMAYSTLIGALVGVTALALDALARGRGVATRFIWLAALFVAMAAPILAGARATDYSPKPAAVSSVPFRTSAVATAAMPRPAPRRSRHLSVRVLVLLLKIDPYLGPLWLAASLAYAFVLLRAVIVLSRRGKQWHRAEIDGEAVLVSPDTGPAVVGAIRPSVVVPQWALSLDTSARALMLRHELEHIKARDPMLLTIGVLANALLPWNAAVWAIVRRLRLAIEIDCDRRVVATLLDARHYGELLLTVGARRRTPLFFVASLVERRGFLEQRIKAMTPSLSRHPRIAAAALVLLALVVSTAAVRAPRPAGGLFVPRLAAGADSLTIAELRALLAAHQPDALVAASGVNTVTVLLDANGNYVTSLAETRAVTGGGRGGRGGGGGALVVSGELSTRDAGIVRSDGKDGPPGGRARGNVRDDVPAGVAVRDEFPAPPGRITQSTEMPQRDPVTGDIVNRVRVTSLSMIAGDTVLLAFRESTGEMGFVKHVYITLDGPIGAGEIFGFNENVLGNLVSIQQVEAVHAHAYAAGELAEQRLNVFVVRLKP